MLNAFRVSDYVSKGILREGEAPTTIPVEPSERYDILVLVDRKNLSSSFYSTRIVGRVYYVRFKNLGELNDKDFIIYKKYRRLHVAGYGGFGSSSTAESLLDALARRFQAFRAFTGTVGNIITDNEFLGDFDDLVFSGVENAPRGLPKVSTRKLTLPPPPPLPIPEVMVLPQGGAQPAGPPGSPDGGVTTTAPPTPTTPVTPPSGGPVPPPIVNPPPPAPDPPAPPAPPVDLNKSLSSKCIH